MLSSALAALFFAGIHSLVSGTPLRDRLVARLGVARYRGLFGLLSVAGLASLILAYRAAPLVMVWMPPIGLRHLATTLMLFAFLFVVLGVSTPSPTAIGGEKWLQKEEAGRGILRITRHPFLVGVTLWSASHLLARGDAASMFFFGAFLFLGLTGPRRIDRRQARLHGASWERFARATSVVPFVAIAQGRNRLVLSELRLGPIAVALALYAFLMVFGHRWLFGVSPLPLP